MIYDRENIQISELCPIQFTEPREYEFYNKQLYYVPKIHDIDLRVRFLISDEIYAGDTLSLRMYDYNTNNLLKEAVFDVIELSDGIYYANKLFFGSLEQVQEFGSDVIVYFEISKTDDSDFIYASSVIYNLNPTYTSDIKKITYSHSENDWNTIFNGDEFMFNVECGFIPKDGRDEQEADDFIEQDMLNDTVYGDGYKVDPLTIGGSMGIPNWLRNKIFRVFLCDNVTIQDEEVKRINGAKMEKIEDCENGLATYKIDLQTTNNYLQ